MNQYMINLRWVCLIACLGYLGCADNLVLEPAQSISEELALDTDANVKAVLVGAYDELGEGDFFGGNTLRDAELQGGDGDIFWVGTFNGPREIFNKNMLAGNADAEERWVEAYQTINIANNVLSALDVVNAADRDRVEGEALFIRALAYFELIRYFAPTYEGGASNGQLGVPLVLAPTRGVSPNNNVARATVEAVYAQILEDLQTAERLLPAGNGFFAGKLAATALLARVYLQMDRYADARDKANEVIAADRYELAPTYAEAFNNDTDSREDIFALQVSTQDGINNLNTFFSVPEFGGRDGDIEVLPAHLARYEPGDERLGLFFQRGETTYTGKFNNQFGNITVIRLAEMYLIRAEANARLNTEVGAAPVDDINTLRDRVGLAPIATVTVEDILAERIRELAFEGFRIHDIKRLQGSTGNISYDSPKLVFPIPAREIAANPNLVQNESY